MYVSCAILWSGGVGKCCLFKMDFNCFLSADGEMEETQQLLGNKSKFTMR